jgi:hypothetical protein
MWSSGTNSHLPLSNAAWKLASAIEGAICKHFLITEHKTICTTYEDIVTRIQVQSVTTHVPRPFKPIEL